MNDLIDQLADLLEDELKTLDPVSKNTWSGRSFTDLTGAVIDGVSYPISNLEIEKAETIQISGFLAMGRAPSKVDVTFDCPTYQDCVRVSGMLKGWVDECRAPSGAFSYKKTITIYSSGKKIAIFEGCFPETVHNCMSEHTMITFSFDVQT